ncbi:MAG: helix-turn-helix domain containing protein [Patescibacteria group bacterium]
MELLRNYSNQTHVLAKLSSLLALPKRQTPDLPERVRKQQHRLTDDEQVKLVAMYQAGSAVLELAEQFRASRQTVSAALNRHGVLRPRRTLSDDEISTACQLYETGWSLAKIGKRFEMDAGTIHDALRKVGVAMRPVGTNQWSGALHGLPADPA